MTLIYKKRHSIAYMTLNRPEAHNCIDPDTVLELVEAWEDYRDDSSHPQPGQQNSGKGQ